MVGLDISLSDLAEDIIYYDVSLNSYAFIFENSSGVSLHHPSFVRPSQLHEQLIHTEIQHVEQHEGFDSIKRLMIERQQGAESLSFGEGENKKHLTYYWRHVNDSPYIIVIVADGNKHWHQSIASPLTSDVEYAYHRLDLTPTPPRLCRHLQQLATLGNDVFNYIYNTIILILHYINIQ